MGVLTAVPVQSDDIRFYAGSLAPMIQLEPDGKITGFSVDLLKEVLAEAGETFSEDIILKTNWGRAVHDVEVTPGTALLALTLLPDRQDRFKWVGPINEIQIGVFGRKADNLVIRHTDDLFKYRIAMVRNTAPMLMLVNSLPGIEEHIVKVSSIRTQLRILHAGRVDLIIQAVKASRHLMQEEGLETEEFSLLYLVEPTRLYYGFNKTTDDEYITRLQAALDRLKRKAVDGRSRYDRIRAKYFSDENATLGPVQSDGD
ncbi:substrate-binding periplasmic protein [Pseudodesulfovibrio sediminis]|uniref:Amino acid ABC transporter substrate-binding protein n=1 Tax=Pseudodesulfovibrio sediminis TaxID=2810563 RepID=A0ABN6EYF8_9BACT|nr:transporter substrate-binding domain-containing protein [Pseudodesulfovibrio sediminis]BCS90289.1 amino acid ABC transporter substrate-binding protein [Pseudodesulfovibrio sediminis]